MKALLMLLASSCAAVSLFAQELTIHPSVEIELATEAGVYYQLQASSDLESWESIGGSFRGTGRVQTRHIRIAPGGLFFRTVESEPAPAEQEETIFQHSTLDALAIGIYEGDLNFGDLLQRGDLGLGTFQGVDGELVVLDGKAYRIRVDGSVSEVDDVTLTPFAAVTFFEPDLVLELSGVENYESFQQQVDAHLPSRNLPYAIRIRGTFQTLTTRSVPAQERPYPPLGDVVAMQTTFEFERVEGTMTGFWYPAFLAGINAGGYHLHYINDALSAGGHVLEFSADPLVVEIDICDRVDVDFPKNEDFLNAALE